MVNDALAGVCIRSKTKQYKPNTTQITMILCIVDLSLYMVMSTGMYFQK